MIHRFVSCITAFLLFLNSFAPAAFALPHVDTDSLRAISTQGTDAERRLTDDSSWETPPRDPAPGSVPGVFAGVFASNAGPLTSYQVAQRLGLARKTVVPDLKMLAQVGVLMTSEGQAGTTYTVIPEAVADPTVVRKLQEVLEQNFPYADVQRESNPERAEADIERILATERVKQTIASNPAVTQAVLQYARGGFGNTEAANREGLARSLERARIPADPDQVGLYARQAMDVLASQHRGVAQGGEMPWTSPPARGSVPGVLEAFHRGLASRLTKQQVADALGLSPRTIEPDLYELTQLGVLVKEGVGDDATYRLAYALREADLFTRTLVDKSLRKFYPRPGMAAAERAAVREQARAEIAQLLPTRVAINGAGRIGVNLIRAWLQQKPRKIDIVAINDIAFNFERFGSRGLEDYVTLLQREFAAAPRSQVGDVTFRHGQHPDGPYWLEVIRKPSQAAGAGANVSDVRRIYVYDGRDPAALPWKANDVDVVLESTGAFTNREAASMHLAAGAKKVIITAPATGELQTIAPGVNQELLTAEDIVLSCASCTTNAIAPPLKLLSDAFGIESFYMETTHAYTADQSLKDTLRPGAFLRGREAAENIIPTSTGAAKAIGDVIPELAGKGTGVALRVPVADGSIVGITAVVEKPTTKAEVNELLRKAAVGPLKGIMAYGEEELVSRDILGRSESSIIAGNMTDVSADGRLVTVWAWYDNEFGYSNRVLDLVSLVRETALPKAATTVREAPPVPLPAEVVDSLAKQQPRVVMALDVRRQWEIVNDLYRFLVDELGISISQHPLVEGVPEREVQVDVKSPNDFVVNLGRKIEPAEIVRAIVRTIAEDPRAEQILPRLSELAQTTEILSSVLKEVQGASRRPPARGSVPGVPGPVQTFVQESAALTGASRIEVVDVSDRARLTAEAIAAGELIDLGDGTSYARSHSQDVARTEERTRVLTRDPADAGEYNRWGHTDEYRPMVVDAMRGESQGQVMYVAPYLMSPPGTPLEKPAIGVELTDDRIVTLNAFTMFRTGDVAREALGDGSVFERGLHVAGDLNAIRRGNPTIGFSDEVDQRRFYTIPDDREMLHYGSAYGGNALLGKIGHGLRQASYDAHKGFGLGGVRWLAEQMGLMEIVIEDAATGQELERYGAVVAAPSGSGKTNLVMLDKVLEVELDGRPVRVRVNLLGDDISWIWEGPDGQLRAFNPENGVFGIAPGTNGRTNASAMAAIGPGSGTIFTNVGINEEQRRVFWEGLEPADRDWVEWVDDEHTVGYPKDITGWRDWQGKLIRERPVEQQRNPAYPWAHPNSRFTTSLTNFPNLSPRWNSSDGIPIHMVILGGRSQTDPLIREARDLAEGVYEGFVMGVEATAAAEGKAGEFREDPMSMRPFFGPDEEAYLENWLDVMGRAEAKGKAPNFFRVNWFRKDKDGKFIWPGYGDNLRALLWAIERIKGQGKFVETPVGNVPTPDAIHREGSTITEDQIAQLTSLDPEALSWDVERRGKHLDKFPLRPEPIRQAHERVVVEEGLWQIGITADAAVEDETADTVRSVKAPRRSR